MSNRKLSAGELLSVRSNWGSAPSSTSHAEICLSAARLCHLENMDALQME
jgi:hypothetical protein